MLTPYAEFDPETGFFLTPDQMQSQSVAQSPEPVAAPAQDIIEVVVQPPDNSGNSDYLFYISILGILVIVIRMVVRKFGKQPSQSA